MMFLEFIVVNNKLTLGKWDFAENLKYKTEKYLSVLYNH